MDKCKSLIGVGVAALLVACGGGGGGESTETPAPTASAEGFWQGPTTSGYIASVAILENGEAWGIYSSGNTIYGAVRGQATVNGNNLTVTGRDFNLVSRTVASGTYSGTFTPKASMNLVNSAAGVSFNGAYQAAYDTPASLSNLAGTFTGSAVTGTTNPSAVSVTISSAGVITVPSSNGCAASGQASPRPGGKNIFNLTVTFSGSTCALGNGATVAGVAYFDSSTKRLLALALNNAQTDGFIFTGVKP